VAGRFLLVTLSILSLHSSAQAQNKIRAAYSSISGIFTPVWIATDERLYQKNQIDADLVYIGGSSVAVSALIAGEIDFIYGGADPIVSGILAARILPSLGLFPIRRRSVFMSSQGSPGSKISKARLWP
jgi:hypothetical protein